MTTRGIQWDAEDEKRNTDFGAQCVCSTYLIEAAEIPQTNSNNTSAAEVTDILNTRLTRVISSCCSSCKDLVTSTVKVNAKL